MYHLRVALGWTILCGLTGAGTYLGLGEIDRGFGLQARLDAAHPAAGASPVAPPTAAPPPAPVSEPSAPRQEPEPIRLPAKPETPGPSSKNAPAPPAEPPISLEEPPADEINPEQVKPGALPRVVAPRALVARDSLVVPPVRYRTTRGQADPPPRAIGEDSAAPTSAQGQTPPVSTAGTTTVDPTPVVDRYNDLFERADAVAAFLQQMEEEMRRVGQPFRRELRVQWNQMVTNLEQAKRAISGRNMSEANRQLERAQVNVEYLERFR